MRLACSPRSKGVSGSNGSGHYCAMRIQVTITQLVKPGRSENEANEPSLGVDDAGECWSRELTEPWKTHSSRKACQSWPPSCREVGLDQEPFPVDSFASIPYTCGLHPLSSPPPYNPSGSESAQTPIGTHQVQYVPDGVRKVTTLVSYIASLMHCLIISICFSQSNRWKGKPTKMLSYLFTDIH